MRKNSLRSQSPTLTPEELAKTQVLNLSDVERVANYEKKTSKKPAIVLAIMGIMSISLGLMYPSVQTMMSKDTTSTKVEERVNDDSYMNSETTTQARVEEVQTTNVTCKINSPSNPDGTDTYLETVFTFENALLKSFAKNYTAVATVGHPTGATTIQNLMNGYKYFDTVDIEGYKTLTTPNQTGNGFLVNINVDLTKFNPQTLPATHKYNSLTNVTYVLDTNQATLVAQLTSQGYVCQ